MHLSLMPYNCEYCGDSFTASKNLKRHQRTKITCLNIQKSRGLQAEREEYKCDFCDYVATQKCQLKTHQAKHNVNAETDGSTHSNFGGIFADISKNQAMDLLQKNIDKIPLDIVKQGITSIIENIAPFILRNNNGNWISRVADASRNKLAVKTSNGEEPDVNGYRTCEILRDPVRAVGRIAFDKTKNENHIVHLLEEIENDESYRRKSITALIRVLPNKFQSSIEDVTSDDTCASQNKDLIKEFKMRECRQENIANCSLYILSTPEYEKSGIFKVGIHSGTVTRLISRYITSLPNLDVKLFVLLSDEKSKRIEKEVKAHFLPKRVSNINGNNSEWFQVPLEELCSFIFSLLNVRK